MDIGMFLYASLLQESSDFRQITRGELIPIGASGYFTSMLAMLALCEFCEIKEGALQVGCNNEKRIDLSAERAPNVSMSRKHVDLI